MGGAPPRLWRFSGRAQRVVAHWRAGDPVGPGRVEQLLARRLTTAGAFHPHPAGSSFTAADVTVVIPVRDRPAQLDRLLDALGGLRCIVVDDGSRDSATSEPIATRHGAACIALPVNRGPATARNAGWDAATTALVAFVDSDCVPAPGWLDSLLAHFEDPLVAAVAPRIVPVPHHSAVGRYEAVRSSLDRGALAGPVRPRSPVPYVPSAALIVRRAVGGSRLFDPRLRVGEDVDLVWRLHDAGWLVRYDPAPRVEHDGPATLADFVGRRASYGTSAGPLGLRHPQHMAPAAASAWSVAVWLLAARRRPVAAACVLSASILVLSHRLRRLVKDPVGTAAVIAGGGTIRSALPTWAGLVRAWSPGLVLALGWRRTRAAAAVALVAPALADWHQQPGTLDALSYAALHVLDDIAYASGLWLGSMRARTARPLIPEVVLQAPQWSNRSLRSAPEGEGSSVGASKPGA
jgi:mycofactocin system glycosyltransferase